MIRLQLDFASCVVGAFGMAVFSVFFSISNKLILRAFYFREQRKLNKKLIQLLERKDDDINN